MKHLKLQTKLRACILLASSVLLILSLYLLNRAWNNNRRADEIISLSRGANFLILTLKDLTFERGRTNVVLSSGRPVSEQDRRFINARRKSVDENMAQGLDWLNNIDLSLAAELKKKYSALLHLREQVDKIITAKNSASTGRLLVREQWFKESTGLIHEIIETTDIIIRRQNLPGHYSNYFRYLITTLEFRDAIGQSGSVMTAAVAKGSRMTSSEYRDFSGTLSKADYLWSRIEILDAAINNSELEKQKSIVYHTYYELYRPTLEDTILQYNAGAVPVKKAKELQALSVPAFDSVFTLKDQIKNVIAADIKKQKHNALNSLVLASFQFIAGAAVIIFIILYFRNRLFKPLTNITLAIEKIRKGENVPDITAEIHRPDEIGLLAEGVKMLQSSMHEERELRKLAEEMAVTDKLTGLNNRHYLEKIIESILTKSDRYDEKVSLAIFDLDHFKQVNDTMGHPAGDAVLKQTANIARSLIRNSDILIRFGGEEFLIIMPHTTSDGAVSVAEKIRNILEKNIHPGIGAVTASFGISERIKDESFNSWYSRADQALYNAKESGRNRIKISKS